MEEIEQRILNDMSAEVIDLLDHQKKTYIGENPIRALTLRFAFAKITRKPISFGISLLNSKSPVFFWQPDRFSGRTKPINSKSLMESLISPHDLKKSKRSLAAPLFGLTASEINELSEDPQVLDFQAERFFQWESFGKVKVFGYVLQNILNSDGFSSLSKKSGRNTFARILREIGGEEDYQYAFRGGIVPSGTRNFLFPEKPPSLVSGAD